MSNKTGETVPIVYSPDLIGKIDKYISLRQEKKKDITLEGFSNSIGISVETLVAWANKKVKDKEGKLTEELSRPEFFAALQKLQGKVEEKKPVVLKKRTTQEDIKPDQVLTLEQELFCRLYTQNTEFFGNATLTYAEAYGFDLDKLDRTREKDERGKEIIGTSEYEKVYNVCSAAGSRLLRNVKVQVFLRKCRNEFMRDDVVDGELVKTILQDYELPSKIAAIREYNKLKQRIIDKIDHTTKGKELPTPILGGATKNE